MAYVLGAIIGPTNPAATKMLDNIHIMVLVANAAISNLVVYF